MQIKRIKVGCWYETAQGVGECLAVGGKHPPSVRMRIVRPFPRGVVFLAPRDVYQEVPQPGAEPPRQNP